ncbi:Sodium-dependent phosphate transporter [Campylobacter jejuni subsp. doylei]|nr:Sodium-dependent phosphate transporter [Campylobacter jejuni subsp. doylei]
MEYFYFSSDFILIRYDELANLLAGMAMLLIGMTNLGIGFKAFSGGLLEKILAKSTDTKIKSILFGTLSTLIMQFSTLVSIYYDFFFECRAYFFGCGHRDYFWSKFRKYGKFLADCWFDKY